MIEREFFLSMVDPSVMTTGMRLMLLLPAAVQGGLEHDPASAYYSDQFSCGGSENSIMQCHHKSENYCSSGRDAGVVCSNEKWYGYGRPYVVDAYGYGPVPVHV